MRHIIVILLIERICGITQPGNFQQNHIITDDRIQFEQMEPIEYLSDVLHFDIILQFLQNNKTVPIDTLESATKNIIAYQRMGQSIGRNMREIQKQSQIINRYKSHKQLPKLQRFDCWLCAKQFKNSSYLAMHYVIKHRTELRNAQYSKLNSEYQEKNEQISHKTIELILSQQIYNKLHAHQLYIIFNSQAPHQYVHTHCTNLLLQSVADINNQGTQQAQHKLSRYSLLGTEDKVHEICTIISMRLHKDSIQLSIFKFISMAVLLIGGVGWLCYFVAHLRDQLQRPIPKSKLY